MKICAFPQGRAMEIVNKYPKSITVLRQFLREYMTAGLQNDESIEVIRHVMNQTNDFGLLTLLSDARKLYDFFDANGLEILISRVGNNVTHQYSAAIVKTAESTSVGITAEVYDLGFSPRTNCELSAFNKAFSLLEELIK